MKSHFLALVLLLLKFSLIAADDELNTFCIRDDILFGVGSASYQIEGAWNYADKSENVWDDLTHNYPEYVSAGANGDVAADSFNNIREDVAQLRRLGVQFYQFSLSWSRLLPDGYPSYVSEVGLNYYNNLIDALLEADIIPMIVLYHWDLPTVLQRLGGWVNPDLIDIYVDYARVAFDSFGERVKFWITFSSPSEVCKAYGSDYRAPAGVYNQTGIGEYLCVNTILKAHARAYHLYSDEYKNREEHNGTIGIALLTNWYEADTVSSADTIAAIRMRQFEIGLFANPIFTPQGNYPSLVRESVDRRSAYEGFPSSRLPPLTSEEIEYIRNTADFFGVNYYTTYIVGDSGPLYGNAPSYFDDLELTYWQPALSWEETAVDSIKVVPWGFRSILLWLQREYNYGVQFYITENGYPDTGEVDDDLRTSFIQRHVSVLVDAITQGVSVGAYTYWNFLDGFEWLEGYNVTFGMVSVNMTDPNRSRTPKSSGSFYRDLINYRTLALDQRCNFTTDPDETTEPSSTTTTTPTTTTTTPTTTTEPTTTTRSTTTTRFTTTAEPTTTTIPAVGDTATTFAYSHSLGITLIISMVIVSLFSIIGS